MFRTFLISILSLNGKECHTACRSIGRCYLPVKDWARVYNKSLWCVAVWCRTCQRALLLPVSHLTDCSLLNCHFLQSLTIVNLVFACSSLNITLICIASKCCCSAFWLLLVQNEAHLDMSVNSKTCNNLSEQLTTTTTTVLRPFVWDYPGEPVPEKKHSPTHHPDHHPIFISFFHLPRSIASSLFKLHAWQSFCTTSLQERVCAVSSLLQNMQNEPLSL